MARWNLLRRHSRRDSIFQSDMMIDRSVTLETTRSSFLWASNFSIRFPIVCLTTQTKFSIHANVGTDYSSTDYQAVYIPKRDWQTHLQYVLQTTNKTVFGIVSANTTSDMFYSSITWLARKQNDSTNTKSKADPIKKWTYCIRSQWFWQTSIAGLQTTKSGSLNDIPPLKPPRTFAETLEHAIKFRIEKNGNC